MKYRFLILSNQNYDFELKTNKWQISNRLANKGYEVVYVDPPVRFRALKRFLKNPSFNLSKLFAGVDHKSSKLIVYKPANIFNFKPFSGFNTKFHLKNINNLLSKQRSNDEKLVVWVYHFDYPELEDLLDKLDYDLLIYDCVDEYTEFPEYAHGKKTTPSLISWIQKIDDALKSKLNQGGLSGVDWVLYREHWLSDMADLIFVSAPGLKDKFKGWGKTAYYLPNGSAFEIFNPKSNSFEEPSDLKDIKHPRIGFTGAIDTYKNNIPLIEKCANELSDMQFVLIGPEKVSDPDLDLSSLKAMKNVHFLGIKEYTLLPSYFGHFDAYFIPYNLTDYLMKGCFPTKYFDSLAAGLPTIVTDMPAYEGFDVDGYVSKNDKEFVENIKKSISENTDERCQKRIKLAEANSWDGKVEKQISLIDNAFPNK